MDSSPTQPRSHTHTNMRSHTLSDIKHMTHVLHPQSHSHAIRHTHINTCCLIHACSPTNPHTTHIALNKFTRTHTFSHIHTLPPPHTHTQSQYIFGKTAIAVLTCPVSLWAQPQSAFSQAHIHFCCLLSSPFPQSLATLP